MHPDSLICTQSRFCTLINFWLRDNLYRDRYATALDPNFCTVPQKWSQPTCTVTAPEHNKICNRTAKTRAIPSLHREKFAAKVPGHYTVLSSGNVYSLNRRAVIASAKSLYSDKTIPDGYIFLQICIISLIKIYMYD
jgi:hypothetical protein